MKKNTRSHRQTPRNPKEPDQSLKILNLGQCLDHLCTHYAPDTDHYHGLAYTRGFSDLETIAKAEKTLRAIGFVGAVEVEHITLDEWRKRSAGYSDWL